jgi:SRSO17 transposase
MEQKHRKGDGMLPDHRQNAALHEFPLFTLKDADVEGFLDELQRFHAAFATCFARKESRENAYTYLVGRLSSLERKTIEAIAHHVVGSRSVRSLQRSLSDGGFNETQILHVYHQMVTEEMGEADGVLVFDESGTVKKGGHSAGVARQYCGTIGKVDNCQVGVYVGYVSRKGYALVDKRLYMPKIWFTDAYAERRRRCHMPEELTFQTKPQQAAEMLLNIYQQAQLPFKYVVADTVYGTNLTFLEAAEQCIGTTYLVAMPADTLCWKQPPLTTTVTSRYRGKVRTKCILKPFAKEPITVAQLASDLHPSYWDRRIVSEGAKGPIAYEFTRRRVTLAKDGLPWKTVWLLVKRTPGDTPTSWYYISNASTSARRPLFIWLSGRRWAIEQCFEEAKQEVGLDQYEGRKFPGWHHHILLCILAHFSLWHLLIMSKKRSTFDHPTGAVTASTGAAGETVFHERDDRVCSGKATEQLSRLSFTSKKRHTKAGGGTLY